MARSLSRILTQIEQLQREAAAIQNEVIGRIRKEIAKFGLTADQLFGGTPTRASVAASKRAKTKKERIVKFADGTGNTWGGMGKRPEWLRQALEAGKSLEDFLVGAAGGKVAEASVTAKAPKRGVKVKAVPAKKAAPAAKKRAAAPAKKAAARKPRTKPAQQVSPS